MSEWLFVAIGVALLIAGLAAYDAWWRQASRRRIEERVNSIMATGRSQSDGERR